MSYFGAAFGTFIGMMIGLVMYSNAWRLSYLPKNYDFTHEWGKKFVKTDNKIYTYFIRSIIGMLFHPLIFVFIWSQEGVMKITILNNEILSAIILLLLEAIGFSVAIWFDFVKIDPKNLKNKIITLQFIVHVIIGFLMGYFYIIF